MPARRTPLSRRLDPPPDPLPLTTGQLRALIVAAFRELCWCLRSVTREARHWRAQAKQIPAEPLRAAALSALATKRGHTDGAALFSILPPSRDRGLLRLLVAYEIIWDYLDTAHESAATEENGRQLHLALVDAFDADRPLADYYRHHPWQDDGGYLTALVETCRRECEALASYQQVRPALVREAYRAQVLALNHLTDPAHRDLALRAWAHDQFPTQSEIEWYELSGAASASLVVHALLALAADPSCTEEDVEATYRAYWPWFSLATTMLDSYADQAEDAVHGNHSYISHYPDSRYALDRIQEAVRQSATRAGALPNGHSHRVILACMIALYLSKDSARAPNMRPNTQWLIQRTGSLPRLLLPLLRTWRVYYHHEAA